MLDQHDRVIYLSDCDEEGRMGAAASKTKPHWGYCVEHLLNYSTDGFLKKIAVVFSLHPNLQRKTVKVMLPGEYLACALMGHLSTSITDLSAGNCWDIKEERICTKLLSLHDVDDSLFASVQETCSVHRELKKDWAEQWGLRTGTALCYKAGDH